jgi:hypothetical protein
MGKFSELPINEKYQLIGKLIDSMVYNDKALEILQKLVIDFEKKGYIKSIILPDGFTTDEVPSYTKQDDHDKTFSNFKLM